MEICDEGLDNLREAIVRRAIEDYELAYVRIYQNYILRGKPFPTRKQDHCDKYINYYRLRDFFNSQWFNDLCNLDPDFVMDNVEKKVREKN